jgi:hypothetical protein
MGANLMGATLIRTDLTKANLTGCFVYGLSAWDVRLDGTIQSNLVITPADTLSITVDNLEVAQFIYLLLNNKQIRDVIDTITSKVVLILGCFTSERKIILDAMPAHRDITETVSTLVFVRGPGFTANGARTARYRTRWGKGEGASWALGPVTLPGLDDLEGH